MAERAHKYEYKIDLDGDTGAARVIRLVKPGSKVLEIGAGPGSVTRHLSGIMKCDVVALEIDPESIERLKEFTRAVHNLDLNSTNWSSELLKKEGKFDYVIAADVLEHVLDPAATLNGMKSLLNDEGSVILCLPHVGHASVAACLLDEDFEYREWGLLDKTHIKFFGIKNIQQLHRDQDMSIEDAQFVVRTPEMTEFASRWSRLPGDVKAALQRNRFCHVYQVVTRAVTKQRASANLDLLSMAVPPPTAKVKSYWKGVMAAIAPPTGSDPRSTFSGPRQGIVSALVAKLSGSKES